MAEDVRVPTLGESISEATIGKWYKAVGDAVTEDEPIVEVETDKVALEINAPVSGVLIEIIAEEGTDVEVGAVIARVDMSCKAAPASKGDIPARPEPRVKELTPDSPKPASQPAAAASAPPPQSSMPISPAVRKLLAEHNLDPASVAGTGKDGRIVKKDVLDAIASGTASAAPAAATAGSAAPVSVEAREERVPMTRLRKRIAERLKEAQNTAAILTTYNEVDMSAIMAARKQYQGEFEKKHGVRLGFMSFFVKACVHALKEIPSVNAEIDGDDIVYKNHYDIGVAVSAPGGLVVPVVRNADQLGFAEVEKTIGDLGRRARDGKLTIDELMGGTFTISNGGVFGSLMSSPILNPPQSGILGMHKIQERPVVVDGEIVIRPMMYLALSYDHRIIDGREAVIFLVRVKDCIEDPSRLLLDI
ncbi:MAG: 2-oxoglutarate dehydrogenase complex dihydrolipoyllysine-residue succinyltransferase [Proteobacteria bacterium]|nr:2-oxoglutarate dehydrogenase complex dihydrolipoyllysine-residue succinyltransferase [Pseudomonadota bacterium]